MQLVVNSTPLDLPPNFRLELEKTNPFFSDKGSQSAPMTLPYTLHNLARLGNPQRLAATGKYINEHNAMCHEGVIQYFGRLVVFSANKAEGINTTFYLDDGDLYTQIKNVHMNQLRLGEPQFSPPAGTAAQKATAWMQHLEAVRWGFFPQEDFAVFPVITKVDESTNPFTFEMLNEPDFTALPYVMYGHAERTVNGVRCPIGYGVTPFLKFNFVLKKLFAHFDYTLQNSAFDTDPDLSKLVLLNNNADTICAGSLDYRQLMPQCNVTTFLDAICNKYCCEFIPDGARKTVTVRFFETASRTPDMDISRYLAGEVQTTHEPFRQLRLTGGTSLPYATPAAESIEKLIRENTFVRAVSEGVFENPGQINTDDVVLRKATGQFYRKVADSSAGLDPIGSCFFGYDREVPKHDYDERTADDEQTPVVEYRRIGNDHYFAPMVTERRHLNTGIKKNNNSEAEEEKSSDECKIMLCFNLGVQSNGIAMGTPFCYGPDGERWGSLSLQYAGEEGLYMRYWRYYESLLRHAFRKITVPLRMPIDKFLDFNLFTPKLINGLPVLPVRLKYAISERGLTIPEAEFYSLRLLNHPNGLPVDLDEEQNPPPFATGSYYWVRFDNYNDLCESYSWIDRWPDMSGVPLATPLSEIEPPTEQQFNTGGRHQVESIQVDILESDHKQNYDGRIVGTATYERWLEPRTR